MPLASEKLVIANGWILGTEVCWKECNKRGGRCLYCGDGYCCNGKEGTYPGWNGDCPTGAIAMAPLKGHRCIRRIKNSTETITELDDTGLIEVPNQEELRQYLSKSYTNEIRKYI